MGEFSTIDTAELVLGARFAGNYFGGEARVLSTRLMQSVQWSAAIEVGTMASTSHISMPSFLRLLLHHCYYYYYYYYYYLTLFSESLLRRATVPDRVVILVILC